ncbi:MAG: hypothetical protein WCG83_02255 [Candidatus Peregrinibacteria bacterium]
MIDFFVKILQVIKALFTVCRCHAMHAGLQSAGVFIDACLVVGYSADMSLRSFFLCALSWKLLLSAIIILGLIAIAPILISDYGYYRVAIEGCAMPFGSKPVPVCGIVIEPHANLSPQEIALGNLIDTGFYAIFTIPLAGVPAIVLLVLAIVLALERGIVKFIVRYRLRENRPR